MSNRYVMLSHRKILRLSGKDARHFLQGLVTQDVESVTDEHSAWTAMLTAQGKYLFDFFMVQEGDGLLLDCDGEQAEALQKLLGVYKLRADVAITPLDWHVVAAMGDLSPLALPEHEGRTQRFAQEGIIACIDPRCAAMAARVLGPAGEPETWVLQRGYAQASITDYEHHRLSLGIPRAGADSVAQKTLILENGFEELHGVSFNKGCYVGQEVTARTKHRANLRKRLYVVRGDRPLPEAGTEVMLGERAVGEMRSSQGTLGLAVIRNDAVESGETLMAAEVTLTAQPPVWRKS